MAWANQQTLAHLETLPQGALGAFATNPDWTVAEIAHHIVDSADFYVYRITGEWAKTSGESIQELESIADISVLKSQAEDIDAALGRSVDLDDIKIEFKNVHGDIVQRWRSTILSQAIHHATEHRAQIASALEAKGFKPVDLDELDLWRYEINNG